MPPIINIFEAGQHIHMCTQARTDIQTHALTQTDRQNDTHKHRHTRTQTHTDTHTHRHTHIHTYIHTYRHTHTHKVQIPTSRTKAILKNQVCTSMLGLKTVHKKLKRK